MSPSKHNLEKLSYSELQELLERSSILEGPQAEAFAQSLTDVALYSTEPRLQIIHTKAILRRMEATNNFDECLSLSHLQECLPSFYLSLALRHVFARGLVVAASKSPHSPVLRRALARLFNLPGFNSCPILQCCAAELLLIALEQATSPGAKEELARQMQQLPGVNYSSDLQALCTKATRALKRGSLDPIIKIDLNQLTLSPINRLKRLFGMGDFRMRVELRGLDNYEQAVVKVPAFSEESARRTATQFISKFLKSQIGSSSRSAKILDIFPPGSTWESGRHPILTIS